MLRLAASGWRRWSCISSASTFSSSMPGMLPCDEGVASVSVWRGFVMRRLDRHGKQPVFSGGCCFVTYPYAHAPALQVAQALARCTGRSSLSVTR